MLRAYCSGILLLLLFVGVLAGCGGGGINPPQNSGSVRGTVAPSTLKSGSGNITVAMDGKNISAPVAADGSFLLDNVPPGLYTMVIKGRQQAGAMVVMVSDGKETNVGQMVLRGAGQIAGLVTDTASGSPISDALVTITEVVISSSEDSPHPVRECHTNSNGSYTVDSLPEGGYLVTISKDGYVTATLNVYVSTGSTATADVALSTADPNAGSMHGVVSGTNSDGTTSLLGGVFVVLTPSGNGDLPPIIPMPARVTNINNKTISLYPMPPLYQQYYAYTADDGTYQIDGIPPGDYTASAMRPGFNSESQSVKITVKQSIKVNFTLSMFVIPIGTVTGTVTSSATGKPISGATVMAVIYGPCLDGARPVGKGTSIGMPDIGFGFDVTTTTNADGKYKLQVPTSTYAVGCYAEGYDYAEQVVNIVQDQTITVDLSMKTATSPPDIPPPPATGK